MDYVIGFPICHETGEIVLIRKNRPAWMVGRLNGIGGKIEPGETPLQAMVREGMEEADACNFHWEHVIEIRYPNATLHFFRSNATGILDQLTTKTAEPLERWQLCGRDEFAELTKELVPNLRWILPLCCEMVAPGQVLTVGHCDFGPFGD